MNRLISFLGVEADIAEIAVQADEMRQRLDEAVASRPRTQEFIQQLERTKPGFGFDDNSDLTEETEAFLKHLGDDNNPFS